MQQHCLMRETRRRHAARHGPLAGGGVVHLGASGSGVRKAATRHQHLAIREQSRCGVKPRKFMLPVLFQPPEPASAGPALVIPSIKATNIA